jgi:cytochrome c peroxidase
MDFTRVEVARYMSATHGAAYQAVFGPLPDLAAAPARAAPGDDAWAQMPEHLQNDVQRVFSNVGKAIEAYERKILCTDTRFDRWMRGDEQLSRDELSGAGTFQDQGCAGCHSGPSFSDGAFHDIGLPSSDRGRALGAPALLADPLNGAGLYSDDPLAGRLKMMSVASETEREGAFRTASLRGVGQRTFFGHAAHQQTLRGFILDVYRRRERGGRTPTVGVLDRKLADVNVEGDNVDELIAFLHTLDCPPLSGELLVP